MNNILFIIIVFFIIIAMAIIYIKQDIFVTVCTGLQAQCNATGITQNSKPTSVGREFGVSDTIEGFQQRNIYNEPENQKLLGQLYSNIKNRTYLNELIKSDYIQAYPWFANNPNGNTTYNKRLFDQSNDIEQIELQNQNYYDFGEITYIGNPL